MRRVLRNRESKIKRLKVAHAERSKGALLAFFSFYLKADLKFLPNKPNFDVFVFPIDCRVVNDYYISEKIL